MSEPTIWGQMYTHLKTSGFDVYSPGQHKGQCTSPYVVIKHAGASRLVGYSTDTHLYDVMCYVPVAEYSTLEPFVESVKESLKKLFPMIKPTGLQDPAFLDDSNQSFMSSVQYQNYRKVNYN